MNKEHERQKEKEKEERRKEREKEEKEKVKEKRKRKRDGQEIEKLETKAEEREKERKEKEKKKEEKIENENETEIEKECINYVREIGNEGIQHGQIFNKDRALKQLMRVCQKTPTFNKQKKAKGKERIRLLREGKIIPEKMKEIHYSKYKEKWVEAEKKEQGNMKRKEVFESMEEEDIPEGKSILECRWIFTKRMKKSGIVRKSRLVVKGYMEIKEIHF